jgi:hypothetical protein
MAAWFRFLLCVEEELLMRTQMHSALDRLPRYTLLVTLTRQFLAWLQYLKASFEWRSGFAAVHG